MPWLNQGRVLVSNVTQLCYRVTSHRVAKGGFGEVFRGVALDDHRDPCADVAVKVSLHALAWHGEAYFGRLLSEQPHVVQLLDAFPVIDGSGPARLVKYVLVFDWMNEGTVSDALSKPNAAWPEDRTFQQIAELLRVLALLHQRGICHGDITPKNVFLRDGSLTALNKPEDYFLVIVEVGEQVSQPRYIRRPFRREPDFGVTSVNYRLEELLDRADPSLM